MQIWKSCVGSWPTLRSEFGPEESWRVAIRCGSTLQSGGAQSAAFESGPTWPRKFGSGGAYLNSFQSNEDQQITTGCPTSNLETLKAYILKSIWLKTKILGAMCVSWGYILFEIIKIFWKISKNGLSSKKLSEMALLVNSFQLK